MMKQFWMLAILAAALWGCKSSTVTQEAPAPDLSAVAKQLVLPRSTLNVPIVVPYAEVAALLNKELAEILYEDRDFDNNGGDNVQLVVRRTGDVRLSAKGEYLQATVPLHIFVKGRVKSTLGGMFSDANAPQLVQDANFNLEVNLNSKLSVQPDWSVNTQSQIGYKWTQRPTLDIGIVKIPIGSLIEKVIDQELNKMAALLDKEAKKQLKFQKQVLGYWNQLQDPMAIPGPVPAWLIINPDSIYLSRLVPEATALRLTAGIGATVLVSTSEPAKGGKKKPMPALQVNRVLGDEVKLTLTAGIDYTTATKLAEQALAGKEMVFEGGKHRVTIEEIEIGGKGESLVAKVKLKGRTKAGLFSKKINGTYYFRGVPYYEPTKQEIRIRNFDFDVKSRDLLLQSAEWLFKSNFKNLVEAQMRYPVKKEIEELRKLAGNSLNQPNLGGIMQLSGSIDRLEPREVQLSDSYMLLIVESSGKLRAGIKAQ
ncbi:MAG: hypothetical protein C0424_07730 [Sphingobacteriaceae bacterium]|nr:hypothetical protein [Sphingobacteriaceae bacterium]